MAPLLSFALAVVMVAAAVLAAPVAKPPCTRLCQLFNYLDRTADGVVDTSDVMAYLDAYYNGQMGSSHPEGVKELLSDLDKDANGLVTMDDFLASFPRLNDAPAAGTSPEMVHLSFDNEWTLSHVVMWVTGDKTATSTVKYGTSSDLLVHIFTGNTHTYTAGGWKGVIHEAHFPALEPSTRYYYRVGDDQGGWSAIFNFLTPPTAGTNGGAPLVFGIVGDMGTAIPLGYKVCEQMEADTKKVPFNALLHVGDIAYASTAMTATDPAQVDSDDGDGEVELVWDLWEKQVEPLAANIPYITGVGNHEKFYNFSAYLNRFRNPAPWGGDPAHAENATFWFGIDYGLAHFVFMSTEHPYDPSSAQYAWLEQEFASVNRTRTPWLVLTGHRPMYSTDTSEKGEHWPGAAFQTIIEPLMIKYNVDMYLCGHMHMYERIHPVRNGTAVQTGNVYHNPGAPMHVVQGTAGVFQDVKYVDPQPAWSAVRTGKLGYGRMSVVNATHVHYEFMYLQTTRVEDEFWLIKN